MLDLCNSEENMPNKIASIASLYEMYLSFVAEGTEEESLSNLNVPREVKTDLIDLKAQQLKLDKFRLKLKTKIKALKQDYSDHCELKKTLVQIRKNSTFRYKISSDDSEVKHFIESLDDHCDIL